MESMNKKTTRYDWSEVSNEIQWIATDRSGKIHGYKSKPVLEKIWWAPQKQETCVFLGYSEKQHTFGSEEWHLLWRDSIEERIKL